MSNRDVYDKDGKLIYKAGEPAEVMVTRLLQHVVRELSSGRKIVHAGTDWVLFEFDPSSGRMTGLKINIELLP